MSRADELQHRALILGTWNETQLEVCVCSVSGSSWCGTTQLIPALAALQSLQTLLSTEGIHKIRGL